MGRRPVPDHLKKKSTDYPQLAIRLSAADKRRILKLADEVVKAQNHPQAKAERFWTKGDVLVEAILLGLEQLKKPSPKSLRRKAL